MREISFIKITNLIIIGTMQVFPAKNINYEK